MTKSAVLLLLILIVVTALFCIAVYMKDINTLQKFRDKTQKTLSNHSGYMNNVDTVTLNDADKEIMKQSRIEIDWVEQDLQKLSPSHNDTSVFIEREQLIYNNIERLRNRKPFIPLAVNKTTSKSKPKTIKKEEQNCPCREQKTGNGQINVPKLTNDESKLPDLF